MLVPESEFLPDETYRFLGQAHTVRSNSEEILDHLRWIYHRFHSRVAPPPDGKSGVVGSAAADLEIVDRRSTAGAIMVRDCLGTYEVPCRDLYAMDADTDPWPDGGFSYPLAHVEGSLLRNISHRAPDYDLIHAGAVSAGGGAVVFPGISGRGKTTMCLNLLRRGFKLLSDEIACVHRDSGVVEPFPRLLKFDEQSRSLLDIPAARATKARSTSNGKPEWRMDVEDLAPSGLSAPAPLRYAILLEGFTERTQLEPVPRLSALFQLSQHSIRQPNDASAALFALAPYLQQVRCFSLRIGDAEEAAAAVEALVDDTDT